MASDTNNTNTESMGVLIFILAIAMIAAEIIVVSLTYKFGLLFWHDVITYTHANLGSTIANFVSVLMGIAVAIAIPILAIKMISFSRKGE